MKWITFSSVLSNNNFIHVSFQVAKMTYFHPRRFGAWAKISFLPPSTSHELSCFSAQQIGCKCSISNSTWDALDDIRRFLSKKNADECIRLHISTGYRDILAFLSSWCQILLHSFHLKPWKMAQKDSRAGVGRISKLAFSFHKFFFLTFFSFYDTAML